LAHTYSCALSRKNKPRYYFHGKNVGGKKEKEEKKEKDRERETVGEKNKKERKNE
jgi:hypothetical protein